jgi:carbonic anhydrase
MKPAAATADALPMILRARRPHLAVAACAVLLAACAKGGDDAAPTTTAPATAARVAPVPAGSPPPHWSYEGTNGPEQWGYLAEEWERCGAGVEQSPIDISEGAPAVAGASSLQFAYHPSAYEVTDNGHTVQVTLADAGTLTIDGTPFTLVQFHFHTPSEHTVGGASYPVEYHLVHRSEAGELAVVAVFVQWGAENEAMAPVFAHLPAAGETLPGPALMDPADLLPPHLAMVRYAGSLTTPPCSEGVRWHVLMAPVQLSRAQIATLAARHPDSRRPVQPLGAREPVIDLEDLVVQRHGPPAAGTGHAPDTAETAETADHATETDADHGGDGH